MSRQQATNRELGIDTARANLLTNGGLEIWQRGAGPFTGSGYTADAWSAWQNAGITATVTREATIKQANSAYSAKVVVTGTVAGQHAAFSQTSVREMTAQLCGLTVTFSAWVHANAGGVFLRAYFAPGALVNSTPHTGNSTWQRLTATAVLPTNMTSFYPELVFDGPGTAYIDNATLVPGAVAADYAPLHPADDLARCYRYYEIIGVPGFGDVICRGAGYSTGTYHDTVIRWRARKAVAPTVTRIGTWTVNGCNQPYATGVSIEGFRLEAAVIAVQADTYTYNSNADGCLTVEANP